MNLEQLKTSRNFIEEQYEVLRKYYTEKKDINNIKEALENFKNNIFTVSFCGQIKAGKSTLLNALLFGEEILPSDDTPHTAKLTKISYADNKYFEVEFYSHEEWIQLEENYSKNEESKKLFHDNEDFAINQGLYKDEVLGQTKKIENIKLLSDYVGKTSRDGGKFTPFVKVVNLYYPNKILKDITFVDTPGINDTNIVRENITIDWIRKSNAVIYVVYANQSFDKEDFSFIEKYLTGIDRDYLIYAINKIDIVTNQEELDSWLNYIAKSPKFQGVGFFKDKRSIIKVSSLGGLIDSYKKNNLEIPEKYKYYIDNLEEKDFLSTKNGLKQLDDLIEEKIIKNRGDDKIIESSLKKINYEYNFKLSELENELENKKNLLDYQSEDAEKRESIKKNYEEDIEKIREIIAGIDSLIKSAINKAEYDMNMYSNKNRISDFLNNKINKCETFPELRSKAYNAGEQIIKNSKMDLLKTIDEIQKTLERNFYDFNIKIKKDFKNEKISLPIYELTQFVNVVNDICLERNNFKIINIEDVIKEKTWWGQRWFDTKGGIGNARASFIQKFTDQLQEDISKAMNSTISELEKELREKFKYMQESIKQKIEIRQNEIEKIDIDLKNGKDVNLSLEKEAQDIKNTIESLRKDQDYFNAKKNEYYR